MRIFFFLLLSFFILRCSTIEVTKEVIKATDSIKTSIKESFPEKKNNSIKKKSSSEFSIEAQRKVLEEMQKEEKNIIISQQKTTEINFIGKNKKSIISLMGNAELSRIDGSIHTLRYDSNNCRLFLFFNQEIKNKKVEYYVIRNNQGELLDTENSLEQCYGEFNLLN